MYKIIILFFLNLLFALNVFSQNLDSLDIASVYNKALVNNNAEKLDLHYSTLHYDSFVDIILLPSVTHSKSQSFKVEIFEREHEDPVRSVTINDSEVFRIPSLAKNKEYSITVFRVNNDGSFSKVASNLSTLKTTRASEFRASTKFFKAISRWSENVNQKQTLLSYLRNNSNAFNVYEIAAFIQYHYAIGKIDDKYSSDISSFINNPPIQSSSPEGPVKKECNCSLVLNTFRDANSISESYEGSPHETAYVVNGDGAAKQMVLGMKGKHGSGKYEANIGGMPALSSVIAYNQFCTDYVLDLPRECMCPKKILYDYSYTSRLTTQAKKGGPWWPWSAGAEAAAEDYAALTIRNGGNVTAADAGRIRISTNCNSNWNADWWKKAAEVIVSAAGVYIDTTATSASWANILPEVVTLFSTNFFNKSGDCTDKHEINTLMSGSGELILTTNKPVVLQLSSLGYEYVRGFGKWHSLATIVSDYHLTAVLLGKDSQRPECCTPNIADYLIGNFEDEYLTIPELDINIKVLDGSVNSDSNLKDNVNKLLTLWGPWPTLERDIYGNYILEGDFGHFIREFRDCAPVDPLQEQEDNSQIRSIDSETTNIKAFPNPVFDYVTIKHKNLVEVSIVNRLGQVVFSEKMDSKVNSFQMDISDLSSGYYIIVGTDKLGNSWTTKIQKI